MAWMARATRFLDMHWVYGQEEQVSCAVACVIMAAYKINKMSPGARGSFSEAEVISLAAAQLGRNPFGARGMRPTDILALLNHPDLGMQGWSGAALPSIILADMLIKHVGVVGYGPTINVKPMILGVRWDQGGGHAVLVDTVRKTSSGLVATVCDPQDANVHMMPVKSGEPLEYAADNVSSDLFGFDPSRRYKKPRQGQVNTTVFWRP